MIALAELEKRYTRDPLTVRLGGIASDLGRLSGLAASSANSPQSFISVLTETKLFTEWAGKEAGPEYKRKFFDYKETLRLGNLNFLLSGL
jgi:hypothetical protein